METPSNTSQLYSTNDLMRWYIDTRDLTASTSSLPLLSTLRPADQERVQKFYHLRDRHMSLASYLLKYLFVHRTCRVSWDQVVISRTPEPHCRPCYVPNKGNNSDSDDGEIPNIEFNVSHQASMVALAGCIARRDSPRNASATASPTADPPTPSSTGPDSEPQVGIDITCVNEREQRSKSSAPTTEAELHAFIDIFSEVFSAREIQDMKTPPPPSPSPPPSIDQRHHHEGDGEDFHRVTRSVAHGLRLFYTYWALKEAYIKMTGEALLAPWLRELEFMNVVAPEPGHASSSRSMGTATASHNDGVRPSFGMPSRGTKVFLHGQEVHDVRIEVVGLGQEYLFATSARGRRVGKSSTTSDAVTKSDRKLETANSGSSALGADYVDSWTPCKAIDIDADITPCATGRCSCLRSSV